MTLLDTIIRIGNCVLIFAMCLLIFKQLLRFRVINRFRVIHIKLCKLETDKLIDSESISYKILSSFVRDLILESELIRFNSKEFKLFMSKKISKEQEELVNEFSQDIQKQKKEVIELYNLLNEAVLQSFFENSIICFLLVIAAKIINFFDKKNTHHRNKRLLIFKDINDESSFSSDYFNKNILLS